MTRVLLASFILLFVCDTQAREINVADHGVVPGKDATYPLLQLIDSVRGERDVTLVFPKARYDFHPDNARERYRAVANHDNGLKRMGFPILSCENLTIDGGGSSFMFHGRMVPVTMDGARGATLKDFSIDWVRPFHAELVVVANDAEAKSFTVECDRESYPYTISRGEVLFDRYGQFDPIGSNIVFDPQTRSPIFRTRDYSLRGKNNKVTSAGEGRFRFENVAKKVPPVGSVVVVYGVHPTSRLCPGIHVTNSSDVVIENVTVHAAGGMALIVERTDNISLDRFAVTSVGERMVSTRADATHFIGCKGTVKVENCLLEHMLDDGINVHGAYVKVEEYLGDSEFLCEISHFQQWGLTFAEPGDKVALLSRSTILPFTETVVEKVKVLNEHRFVMTLSDVPEVLPHGPLSAENLTWNPDLIMRNNIIRENRARSVLVTTKGKVVIERNHFASQMHGILIEGDNNKWYESGAVRDVTIRNNVFENIGFEATQRYPLVAAPLLTRKQHTGEGYYHRNIRFINNRIKSFNGLIVNARSVQGLDVSGNRVEFTGTYPRVDEGPSIMLDYCSDVSIQQNEMHGFAEPPPMIHAKNTAEELIEGNQGFGQRPPIISNPDEG